MSKQIRPLRLGRLGDPKNSLVRKINELAEAFNSLSSEEEREEYPAVIKQFTDEDALYYLYEDETWRKLEMSPTDKQVKTEVKTNKEDIKTDKQGREDWVDYNLRGIKEAVDKIASTDKQVKTKAKTNKEDVKTDKQDGEGGYYPSLSNLPPEEKKDVGVDISGSVKLKDSPQSSWEEEFDKRFIAFNDPPILDGFAHKEVKDFIHTHFIEKEKVNEAISRIELLQEKLEGKYISKEKVRGEIRVLRKRKDLKRSTDDKRYPIGYNTALSDLEARLGLEEK